MPESGSPKPVTEVIATLADIFRHQRRGEILELLECAHAYFDQTEYDNWNGGTYTWALRLEVPIPIFATIEPRLEVIEKEIGGKLGYLERLYSNNHFGEVTITPISPGSMVLGQRTAPSEIDVRHLWIEDRFRLFLSHVSEHKVAVSNLKDKLAYFGIAAFVAHEDIEPSREWLDEVELALRSMHALVALITPDFHASRWTDQEIGWGLGRGVLVAPVRLGADPYGFSGKYQGISGTLEQPETLARSIVDVLLANTQTRREMRRPLVGAFADSKSYSMALDLCSLVERLSDFTDDEKAILHKACVENNQTGAHLVRKRIYDLIGRPPMPKPAEINDEIPF